MAHNGESGQAHNGEPVCTLRVGWLIRGSLSVHDGEPGGSYGESQRAYMRSQEALNEKAEGSLDTGGSSGRTERAGALSTTSLLT